MNMFDMEQYDENESENGFEDFSNNEDNDLTEEEKIENDLLNEWEDTINLIKER